MTPSPAYGGALSVIGVNSATLHGCTLVGNLARDGGAISVLTSEGRLLAVQCTLTGNRASAGAGGALLALGTSTLVACTVASNTSVHAGGAFGTVVMSNCLVAANTGGAAPDFNGTLTSGGHNLLGVGAGLPQSTDLFGTLAAPLDPRLGPLRDNGGPTPTMAPLPGSPLLEAGDDALVSSLGLATDQRGQPRLSGCHVDIGAYETTFASCDHTVVRNLSGSGPGSLREAVLNSPVGSVITFPSQLAGTITLTSEILLNKNLTIAGPGAGQLRISGNDASRVFNVTAGATGALSGLTITRGRVVATDLGACAEGGAILNSGALRLTNCTFTANSVVGAPGADAFLFFSAGPGGCGQGGAIANYGDLTVMLCTFTFNQARGGVGGGGGSDRPRGGLGGAGRGGALWSGPGRLAVFDSTLGTNTATGGVGGPGTDVGAGQNDAAVGGFGGAASGGGLYMVSGTLEVRGCALVGNETTGGQGGRGGNSGAGRGGNGGGGGNGAGGGLWAESSAAPPLLVNCTVYANEAHLGRGGDGGIGTGGPNGAAGTRGLGQGGGLHVSGAGAFIPRVYLCTITRNFADGRLGTVGGGGIEGRAECRSTLVAVNFAADAIIGAPDCAGDFTSSSFNLIGIADGSTGFTGPNNQVGSLSFPLDPQLGLFGYYGGPTQVLPLSACSPAVDRGATSLASDPVAPILTDQRGFPRLIGAGVDVGAYEKRFDFLTDVEVTTPADCQHGSLRDAIFCVAPGGTITFAPNVIGAITLTHGELVLNKSVHILGPGADRLAISGGGRSRLFKVLSNSSPVTLAGITIRDGRVTVRTGDRDSKVAGGAIMAFSSLTISNCNITGNAAVAIGTPGLSWGIDAEGGAIWTWAPLTLVNSVVSHNWGIGSDSVCEGAFSSGVGHCFGGGIFVAYQTFFAMNCTFASNSATGGVAGCAGGQGGHASGGHVFFGNTAQSAWFVNCTLVGGRVQGGRGTLLAGGAEGGAISTLAPFSLQNTILANNSILDEGDASGAFISLGHNLISVANGSSGWTDTDLTGNESAPLDAKVEPLALNGGPTPTCALLPGSPAIDAGDNASLGPPWNLRTDQRGYVRWVDLPSVVNAPASGGVDIGAYEFGSSPTGPPLSVRRGTSAVILSWPNPSTGFVLQQTANMSAPGGGWVDVTQPPVVNGANKEVALQVTGHICFFRLSRP